MRYYFQEILLSDKLYHPSALFSFHGGGARYHASRTMKPKRKNMCHVSKRVRRKHRRAA